MKSFISGNTLANEARMRRASFDGVLLFVEGESDERLFGIFVNSVTCQMILCHGRENLLEACGNLSDMEGVLAIADADFEHLEKRPPPYDFILFTDWHDAECMMLRGSALDRVLSQFVSRQKLASWTQKMDLDVRSHLLAQSAAIGYLLWHSAANNLQLKFSTLEVREFVDNATLETNEHNLVKHVKNKSQRHDLPSEQLLSGIQERRNLSADLWQIVRGHDFVDYLGYALRFALGNNHATDVTCERLELSLRLSFSADELAATSLYASVKNWELTHHPYKVFNDPLQRAVRALN